MTTHQRTEKEARIARALLATAIVFALFSATF